MKKIGFCFLCIDNINKIEIWEKFFKDNYHLCNIYIHSKNRNNITQNFVKKYQIKEIVQTSWGSDLVSAIKLLYKQSINNNDYKTVLLSESTIPVKNFKYVYEYLTENDKSYVYHQTHLAKTKHEEGTLNMQYRKYVKNISRCPKFLNYIDISHWYYNPTWVILNNKHLKIIFEENKIFNVLKKGAICWDENYVSYVLSDEGELSNVINEKNTFVNWKERVKRSNGGYSPKLYVNINSKDVLNFLSSNILFARKFSKDSNIEKYIGDLFNIQYNSKCNKHK